MTDYTIVPSQVSDMERALLIYPPEIRDDAATMILGTIAQEAPGSGRGGTTLDHTNSRGGAGNRYTGLFQQTDASFQWGRDSYDSSYQKYVGADRTAAGSAAQAFLGHTYDAFQYANEKEGAQPHLFHANWAQFGRANFAELMRIKKEYPNDRLIDLEEKWKRGEFKLKYNQSFFSHMRGQSKASMDMLKTVPENEEMIWNNFYNKNGIGPEGRRSYAKGVWSSVMKRKWKQ